MAKNETYVGDEQKVFNITVYRSDTETALDISGAVTTTARTVYFVRSDASVVTSTASFVTSGTDGALVLTTPTSLFSVDGEYKMQLRLSLGSGNVLHSDVYSFDVLPKIY